ncbi:hypothetical protein CAOG_04236 [Capsaspora owczarzaki ATCC 30864]|nr:hypothetical protein CAOG_04236 [Capsaspora owczarzaki ATCC 30864]|eukprot:XP_004348061.2 hypothetical protein CAOG_04236 [Capsaspora owczarzaki ATCC 30864]
MSSLSCATVPRSATPSVPWLRSAEAALQAILAALNGTSPCQLPYASKKSNLTCQELILEIKKVFRCGTCESSLSLDFVPAPDSNAIPSIQSDHRNALVYVKVRDASDSFTTFTLHVPPLPGGAVASLVSSSTLPKPPAVRRRTYADTVFGSVKDVCAALPFESLEAITHRTRVTQTEAPAFRAGEQLQVPEDLAVEYKIGPTGLGLAMDETDLLNFLQHKQGLLEPLLNAASMRLSLGVSDDLFVVGVHLQTSAIDVVLSQWLWKHIIPSPPELGVELHPIILPVTTPATKVTWLSPEKVSSFVIEARGCAARLSLDNNGEFVPMLVYESAPQYKDIAASTLDQLHAAIGRGEPLPPGRVPPGLMELLQNAATVDDIPAMIAEYIQQRHVVEFTHNLGTVNPRFISCDRQFAPVGNNEVAPTTIQYHPAAIWLRAKPLRRSTHALVSSLGTGRLRLRHWPRATTANAEQHLGCKQYWVYESSSENIERSLAETNKQRQRSLEDFWACSPFAPAVIIVDADEHVCKALTALAFEVKSHTAGNIAIVLLVRLCDAPRLRKLVKKFCDALPEGATLDDICLADAPAVWLSPDGGISTALPENTTLQAFEVVCVPPVQPTDVKAQTLVKWMRSGEPAPWGMLCANALGLRSECTVLVDTVEKFASTTSRVVVHMLKGSRACGMTTVLRQAALLLAQRGRFGRVLWARPMTHPCPLDETRVADEIRRLLVDSDGVSVLFVDETAQHVIPLVPENARCVLVHVPVKGQHDQHPICIAPLLARDDVRSFCEPLLERLDRDSRNALKHVRDRKDPHPAERHILNYVFAAVTASSRSATAFVSDCLAGFADEARPLLALFALVTLFDFRGETWFNRVMAQPLTQHLGVKQLLRVTDSSVTFWHPQIAMLCLSELFLQSGQRELILWDDERMKPVARVDCHQMLCEAFECAVKSALQVMPYIDVQRMIRRLLFDRPVNYAFSLLVTCLDWSPDAVPAYDRMCEAVTRYLNADDRVHMFIHRCRRLRLRTPRKDKNQFYAAALLPLSAKAVELAGTGRLQPLALHNQAMCLEDSEQLPEALEVLTNLWNADKLPRTASATVHQHRRVKTARVGLRIAELLGEQAAIDQWKARLDDSDPPAAADSDDDVDTLRATAASLDEDVDSLAATDLVPDPPATSLFPLILPQLSACD